MLQNGEYDPTDDKHRYEVVLACFSSYSRCCNFLYRKSLAVVFTPLLEKELRQFMTHSNTHRIRENRLADCPGGIPEDLYDI